MSPSLTALQLQKDSPMPEDQGAVAPLLPTEGQDAAVVAAALRDADEISERIYKGNYRGNLSDTETLRNHVRKLAKALSSHQPTVSPAEQVETGPSYEQVIAGVTRSVESVMTVIHGVAAADESDIRAAIAAGVALAFAGLIEPVPTPPAEGSGR